MKKLLIYIIGVMASMSAKAQITYTTADSMFVVTALAEARSLPRTTCFPLHFARLLLDRPYVAHTLEVNDKERLIVNTRQLDCATLVENVTALTLCTYRKLYTWRDFLNALVQMRYRGGKLDGYTSRLHYFSDWIDDNSRQELVTEVQSPTPPFTATQTLVTNYMSRHPKAYKALKAHPELIPIIAEQEKLLTGKTYRYIPKAEIRNSQTLRNAVHDGDIIAITCTKPGLDIAHLGFAVWRNDGLHLLNASQLHKKVVEEPMTLGLYLSKHPLHSGIRVIRINK